MLTACVNEPLDSLRSVAASFHAFGGKKNQKKQHAGFSHGVSLCSSADYVWEKLWSVMTDIFISWLLWDCVLLCLLNFLPLLCPFYIFLFILFFFKIKHGLKMKSNAICKNKKRGLLEGWSGWLLFWLVDLSRSRWKATAVVCQASPRRLKSRLHLILGVRSSPALKATRWQGVKTHTCLGDVAFVFFFVMFGPFVQKQTGCSSL